ncbi:LytR C-terminal domain-containing protein [Cryobacterium sp. PH31-O1]|uniref:LytR C-terminal domain-containing protein n=1 Tax=Cryobacterium sp. PH31-O1 TaxID=3046306 RepID=UPI0024B87BB0|nr:LytR C-terminal domain-containing protein [Cryobacterium sp. PH31-O1]MDJ0338309.1 LytR C-terminal domain-containing protein [Cryobacterium sp. PH31-O1]
MARKFAKDRFDTHTHALDRVGAHRAPGKRGRGWIGFWWALGATVLLIVVGVVGIFAINNRLDFSNLPGLSSASSTPTPTESVIPTAEPTVDPELTVNVLNGSANDGVAASVSDTLVAAGWVVSGTGNASTNTEPTTVIYYADTSQEGAARGLAASLPGSKIVVSTVFSESDAALTVVVGNDYVSPEG